MIITDNGSNMLKAVKVANKMQHGGEDSEHEEQNDVADDEEEEEDDEETDGEEDTDDDEESAVLADTFHRFPCIAHTLQLLVKELSRNQAYCNLINKVKQLVRSVKMSSVALEKLTAFCGNVVIKNCTTRWNSVLLMVERLTEVRPHLEEVLKELKHDSLSKTEWTSRLADLKCLLTPFRDQTNFLQTHCHCHLLFLHSLNFLCTCRTSLFQRHTRPPYCSHSVSALPYFWIHLPLLLILCLQPPASWIPPCQQL